MSKSHTSESNLSSSLDSEELSFQNESFEFSITDIRYKEFKDYLNSKDKGLNLSSVYMKRTLIEDIEPTLNFNINK